MNLRIFPVNSKLLRFPAGSNVRPAVDKTTPFGTNAMPRAVNGACVRPAHGLHVMRHHRRATDFEEAGVIEVDAKPQEQQ